MNKTNQSIPVTKLTLSKNICQSCSTIICQIIIICYFLGPLLQIDAAHNSFHKYSIQTFDYFHFINTHEIIIIDILRNFVHAKMDERNNRNFRKFPLRQYVGTRSFQNFQKFP